jgi:hypothetical protein
MKRSYKLFLKRSYKTFYETVRQKCANFFCIGNIIGSTIAAQKVRRYAAHIPPHVAYETED